MDTLEKEYLRDVQAGLPIEPPENYYEGNDVHAAPRLLWRAHGALLFANWLNYFVYQETPYDIGSIPKEKHRG